ncbi:LOW QUALITY PROTEIN: subtilisin-like protease SBT1.2 [Curcuma longa]|uniref:LOW QUALITY PROTEIN: subtilisin-like protease SBT1.2 n=1 Tax=Curcuma longa TaxID=136217 RepID=UPI003D9E4196
MDPVRFLSSNNGAESSSLSSYLSFPVRRREPEPSLPHGKCLSFSNPHAAAALSNTLQHQRFSNTRYSFALSSMDSIVFFFFSFFLWARCHGFQTYIVQLHPPDLGSVQSKHHWHLSFLEKTVLLDEEDDVSSRLLYSYHAALEGFAAQLTDDEAVALRALPGVVSVRPDRRIELHTTYSSRFLGLNFAAGGAWSRSGFGQGTIVGVLDTGVWPESPSFRDDGMPPVPARWKGGCEVGEQFNASSCNRKLIGARFYAKGHRINYPDQKSVAAGVSLLEYVSPRDAHGHGTHTLSTAAGGKVASASVLGVGAGDAHGMAPRAHVAAYKVCWFNGCYSSDILAGMDDAIRDGVDVLSLSLGGFPIPLFEDSIAIGSFRATERGVVVVAAAGNNGPVSSSVSNEAPWITTVGASTLDRRFPAFVRLGNGKMLYGESMFPGNHFSKSGEELELVFEYGGQTGAEFCLRGSLSKEKVQGKMVVCDRGVNGRAEKGEAVKEAGGAAMVLANSEINQQEDSVDVHVLPATLIGYKESTILKAYMNSTRRPVAKLVYGGTRIRPSRAPAVALFSSRGPSLTNPSVLKPDLIAPGVNIIAAWPSNIGPSGLREDRRRSNFTVLSGTSMACPHVGGIAALVRAAHPSWTPAAVRSAMMTTADVVDHLGKPIMDVEAKATLFAMGAGHVNPARAIYPGLIYDIEPEDYIAHLCSIGYNHAQVFTITHRNVSCGELLRRRKHFSLNYPSISVSFKEGRRLLMVQRRVTNVGLPNSRYIVQVAPPAGVAVRVAPATLTFKEINESKSYTILMESMKNERGRYAEGQLVWIHANYKVRSPISVTWEG